MARRPGKPFPNLERLEDALTRRLWQAPDLARAAGISPAAAYKALAGENISPKTTEAIAQAIADNPAPKTATSAWLAGEVA